MVFLCGGTPLVYDVLRMARRSRIVLASVLTLAALAGVLWPCVSTLHPRRFGVVEEGKVYRSGRLSPVALARLHERHKIRTIIDLGTYPEGSAGERREAETARALGIRRYRFELSGDSTGNPAYYARALAIMTDPAQQPVLVHCGAGSERTGMACIQYRHHAQGVPVERALLEAREFDHEEAKNPRLEEMVSRWTAPIGSGELITEASAAGAQSK